VQSLARGVLRLRGLPPNTINVYLVGGVLVDAGTPATRSRILRRLDGRDVHAHALRPALVLVGHGPPLRDPQRLARAAVA